MSNVPQRVVLPGSRSLLSRVLDQQDLPAQIQNLPPTVFGKLIDNVGLEDAGELLALATTEQLSHAFDEDLWKNQRPGEEEQFDADRFLVWLEVLLEAGDAFVASKLAEMPEDLVTLALHKHLLVLDVDALAQDMQAADEVDARQLDKALESSLYEELNGFQLMARDPDGWDSILAILLALDRDHHDFLQRVLEHCCAMSSEYIEDNGGLYEVLTSEEMLEGDVAADREDRRAAEGHVAPSSATAFLKLARGGTGVPEGERDPMTRAYFRNLRPPSKGGGATATGSSARPSGPTKPARAGQDAASPVSGGVVEALKDAGLLEQPSVQHLLGTGNRDRDPRESLLLDAMRFLAEEEPDSFRERSEELAYLTNVLVAGCSREQRRLRPIEAVRVALAVCNLGLCLTLESRTKRSGASLSKQAQRALRETTADGLFRSAWQRLHADVVDRAARVALQLFDRAASNAEDEEECIAFKRARSTLRKACDAGEPWRAATSLDSLMGSNDEGASFEESDIDILRGLLDQCPMLPASSKHDGLLATPTVLLEAEKVLDRLEKADVAERSGQPGHPAPGHSSPGQPTPGQPGQPTPGRRPALGSSPSKPRDSKSKRKG